MRAFTLVEVLVVISLIGMVAVFALLVSLDSYRESSFHGDRTSLIAALQHARAEAVNDICAGDDCTTAAPHGVSIQEDSYVIFEGSSYAARDISQDSVIQADPSVIRNGLNEIVFEASSGDASSIGAITLSAEGRTSVITIGDEGQITWTN